MRYVRDHYSASRVVRECVAGHRHWCADVFLNFIDMGSATLAHRQSGVERPTDEENCNDRSKDGVRDDGRTQQCGEESY